METNKQNSTPEQTSPGLTRSALVIGAPGCTSDKWATGKKPTRRKWTQQENKEVMACYIKSDPSKRGYRKRMVKIWSECHPGSTISEQRLMDQRRLIENRHLLTSLEIEEIRRSINTGVVSQSREQDTPTEAIPPVEQEPLDEEPQVPLTAAQQALQDEIIEEMANIQEIRSPVKISKEHMPELFRLVSQANQAIRNISTENITETNKLMYATAKTIEKRICPHVARKKPTETRSHIPPWQRRLEDKIKNIRKDISKMTAAKTGKHHLTWTVNRRYWVQERGIDHAVEDAKQRLTALSHRIQRYKARKEQYRTNKLFRTQPGRIYQELKDPKSNQAQPVPDKKETEEFWKNIWGVAKQHNSEAAWIQDIKDQNKDIPQQPSMEISVDDVQQKVKRMSNWKAPGPDQVQAFWPEHLSVLHKRIAHQLQKILDDPQEMPDWLTRGRTTLLQKDPQKGTTPKNYRPITCLPTTWKLFSGIIADKVMAHLNQHKLLAYEQKGVRPGSRGTKDQLLIDKTVCNDSKRRRTNLAVAWIDYQKAYDSVPHSWILESMKLYKIDQKIQRVVQESMRHWCTMLTSSGEALAEIQIKCGIFQGDALSPLLFCVALNPLSNIIERTGFGYTLKSGQRIHHLLYMDDLKLYGKKEREIDSLINTVRIFSDDIGMKFGLEKCARLVVERGKVKQTDGLQLNIGNIQDVEVSQGYKYLGILQGQENLQQEVKSKATHLYFKRVKQVLKSKLNGQNKIQAINTYAMPVLSYMGGVIEWTQSEIEELDRKTRKTLNMYKGLHPRSDTHRLYLPRQKGGRGLKEVKATIQEEKQGLDDYLWRKKDAEPLLKAVWDAKGTVMPPDTKKVWRDRWTTKVLDTWKNKPLHGQYAKQVDSVTDEEHAYKWMKTTGLKIETEALITAAQEQALNTKQHQAKVLHTTKDPTCRLCKSANETVTHILAACPKLAQTEYLKRHNAVAAVIHKNICDEYGIETAKQTWLHHPEAVTETEEVKILWDFEIRTDRVIPARRPDIVVLDKEERKLTIIDVAVPSDANIKDKETEKITKYQDLKIELQRMWNVKARVVPVVVGALGATSPGIEKHLDNIPGKQDVRPLLKSALLGSAHILRKVLDLPGSW